MPDDIISAGAFFHKEQVCRACDHAKQKFGESCYCTLYGIIIGYSKRECRGFEREQVQSDSDRN